MRRVSFSEQVQTKEVLALSSEDEDEGAGVGKENSGDDNDDEDDEEGGDEELEEEGGKSKGDAFEKALERRMSLDFEVDDEAQELLSSPRQHYLSPCQC